MEVYVIASFTIKDRVPFEDYRRTVLSTMEKYGGRLVARGSLLFSKESGRANA